MRKGSFLLAGLLVASVFVVGGNSSASKSFAEERDREPDRTAAPISGPAPTDPGNIVIASGNNRFAVWQDDTPGNNDIFFRRSTDNGATWQPIVNLSNNPGESVTPQITVSGSKVYIVWAQQNAAGTTRDAFFIRSLDNGATFGPKVKISTADTDDLFLTRPQVAASGNFVYVTWMDFGAKEAFFRRSINNGGSFQGVVNISNSGTADFLNIVALAAAGTRVYVMWDDFFDSKDVLLRASTNNGAAFGAVKNLSNGGGADAHGLEVVATGTNVYAGWSDFLAAGNYEVFFARSTNSGGSFSAKVNLSNNAGFSDKLQIAFSGVNVFVTWNDNTTPGNYDVLMKRSVNSGASFQGVKNLSNNAGDSENPQVATSGANVYFTWSDTTPGNPDIFLRRSTNNGGTLQPLVQISNNAGDSALPQVTTVGANVYIIWQDNTPGNYDIIDRRSTNNGATWNPTQNLSTNAGDSLFAQIDG